MEIFLVRHGETGGNIAHRHQAESTPLSMKGRQQAEEVAKVICEYNPTHVVTSSLVRAVETARVIAETCDIIPDTNQHLVELSRPEHMYGQFHSSLKSFLFYAQWYFGIEKKSKNGESYSELRERFELAKESLTQYPNDARVVVVSHSVFINLFLAHLCSKKVLNPFKALITFRGVVSMPNTHLVKVLHDNNAAPNTCAWSVIK